MTTNTIPRVSGTVRIAEALARSLPTLCPAELLAVRCPFGRDAEPDCIERADAEGYLTACWQAALDAAGRRTTREGG